MKVSYNIYYALVLRLLKICFLVFRGRTFSEHLGWLESYTDESLTFLFSMSLHSTTREKAYIHRHTSDEKKSGINTEYDPRS